MTQQSSLGAAQVYALLTRVFVMDPGATPSPSSAAAPLRLYSDVAVDVAELESKLLVSRKYFTYTPTALEISLF